MESRRVRAWSALRTGVLPRFTTYFGPRTELAGFVGMTWPVTSQSKSIRIAAKCCFTVGEALGCCSMYAAITTGLILSRSEMPRASHQRKNCATAWAYAARVLRLRIFAVKNSTKRQAAPSPARAIAVGKFSRPARFMSRDGMGTMSWLMLAGLRAQRSRPGQDHLHFQNPRWGSPSPRRLDATARRCRRGADF